MLISEIGDVVEHYKEIQRLDILIEAAKDGKILLHVNGANQGPDLAEAVQHTVISHLRALRGVHTRELLKHGYTE